MYLFLNVFCDLCLVGWGFSSVYIFVSISNLLRVSRDSLEVLFSCVLCLDWDRWRDLS